MLAIKHASKVGERRRGGASSRSDAQLVPPSPEQLWAGVDKYTQTDYVECTAPVPTPDPSDWRYEEDDGASASGALMAMSRAPSAAAPSTQPTRPSCPFTATLVLWGGVGRKGDNGESTFTADLREQLHAWRGATTSDSSSH